MPPIIFRDLKPDNIMISPNGMLKLIDFGIARTFKAGRAGDTELLGTPGFAPPEQYGQGSSQTGPYTDVYALGVTLMRLATGYDPSQSPFQTPRADAVKPGISRGFANALEIATKVDYHQRYQTMQAFQQALQTSGQKRQTSAPKYPVAAGIISAVVLLVLAAIAAIATGLLPMNLPAALAPVSTQVGGTSATATVEPTALPGAKDTPLPPTDTAQPAATALPPAAATGTAVAERTRVANDVWKTATAISQATRDAGGAQPAAPATVTPNTADTSATATPEPTDTPAPVSAATPVSPTSTPSSGTSSGTGGTDKTTNALFSFEQPVSWRRGDQPYGDLTYSTDQAHDGTGSAKLTYNIPSVSDHFVVFINRTPLPGQPTGMVAWVYGDGSGNFLNTWIEDSAGQVRQFTFGRVYHTGWQQMVAWFDTSAPWPQNHISGPDSTALQYPVNFYALVLDKAGSGSGSIYIDEVNFTTQAITVKATQPAAQATNAPGATAAPTQPPPPPSGSTDACDFSSVHISNLCVGNNPVPKGGSTNAVWRIDIGFKSGCLDKGDGAGCVGPIAKEMNVNLGTFNAPRRITLSWVDDKDVTHTSSVTVQVQ